MSPLRYRDEGSSSGIILGAVVGALAGFAAGMYLAQNAGSRTQAQIEGEHEDEEEHERIRGAHATSDELDEDFEELEPDLKGLVRILPPRPSDTLV